MKFEVLKINHLKRNILIGVLIYDGTSAHVNGEASTDRQIGTTKFNESSNYSYYVGLSYSNSQHGNGTPSTILTALNNWYKTNIENQNLDDNVSTETGFCNDREMASGYTWVATGATIQYAAYERIRTNKAPNLQCNEADILKIPVGLITADEAAIAGGVYRTENNNYYLKSGEIYWTMTPFHFSFNSPSGTTSMYAINAEGDIDDWKMSSSSYGIRPVINLRANIIISGTGTSSDPYKLSVQ